MTQSLRRDCELLATFDSDHADAANGVVKDFSGKQRHLEASGGPTYGQSSPVGEAVAFDGTDDVFTTDGITIEQDTAYTGVMIYQPTGTDDNAGRLSIADNKIGFVHGSNRSDTISYGFDSGSAITSAFTDPFAVSRDFVLSFFRVVPSKTLLQARTLSSDGIEQSVTNTENWDGVYDATGGGTTRIGKADTFGPKFHQANVAFVGIWSRALSDAEIEELNRMTDRMVSKL